MISPNSLAIKKPSPNHCGSLYQKPYTTKMVFHW